MKRIFTALQLNSISRRLLYGCGSHMPGARAVPEEQLHLTLRFIGEVDGTTFLDLKDILGTIQARPVVISIKGVGHFPPRGKPKVLWAGVEPTAELLILRNKVNSALRRVGIEPEKRKFHPHITLARLNNSPLNRVGQFLTDNSLLEIPPFMVDTLTLYSSKLTHKGPIHNIEAQYQLLTE